MLPPVLRRSRALQFLLFTALIATVLAALNRGSELVVHFDLESASAEGPVVVYYDRGFGFAEAATVSRPLRAGLQHYDLRLPVSRIVGLRIDPSANDRTTLMRDVAVSAGGTVIRQFEAAALTPSRDIVRSQVEDSGRAVRFSVRPGAQDPYFIVQGAELAGPSWDAGRFAGLVFIAACAAAAMLFVAALGEGKAARGATVAGTAFGIVTGVVMALALLTTTRGSVNPDEFNHMQAARYYVDRWLPPAVADPASMPSYSDYGTSYLNEIDIVYLLAGKFTASTEFTGLDDLLRMRLFNVALLVLCVVVATRSGAAPRMVLLPLLCTAQAWYLFGYFNGDGLALASALLLGCAVVAWCERGPVPARVDIAWALALGVLLALCLLSKRNLYPFVPFIAGYALWRSGLASRRAFACGAGGLFILAFWVYARPPFPRVEALIAETGRVAILLSASALLAAAAYFGHRDRPPGWRIPPTLLAALGIALALVAVRFSTDIAINGAPSGKARALAELAERIARADLRPSVLGTPSSYVGVALAGRGVGLGEMLVGPYQWLSNMSKSFFGVYGYMVIFGPAWLYWAQYAMGVALVAAIGAAALRDSPLPLALGAACIALTLELTMLHSWVLDLQFQGRYAFAILPIVGILWSEGARRARADAMAIRLSYVALAILWALALGSFAFVALPNVVRL